MCIFIFSLYYLDIFFIYFVVYKNNTFKKQRRRNFEQIFVQRIDIIISKLILRN